MRVVVQRVKYARCHIDGQIYSEIKDGYCLLVGVSVNDSLDTMEKMAYRVAHLRVLEDDNGKMNLDLLKKGGSILSISQFTLCANTDKGHRPSFIDAKRPEEARDYYLYFNECLRKYGIEVKEGVFQADMGIEIYNDGPVTIVLDSKE